MKPFETPVIEIITFTAESIMSNSVTTPPTGEDMTPWG